ncbi:hypothetical protein HGA91_05700 [candidate division WWE3 bacterium]|nr:hypothetical protein [candidate division WWE3 bacterium]
MNKQTIKKIIGSLGIISIAGLLLFASADIVQARFLYTKNSLLADGVVGSVTNNSFVFYASGSDPIKVSYDRKTVITPRHTALHNGDYIDLTGKVNGSRVTANIVRIKRGDGEGYGSEGTNVIITEGKIIDKTSNTLEVKTKISDINFMITPSTRFIGKTLSKLKVNDTVYISGEDTGNSFVAHLVIKK